MIPQQFNEYDIKSGRLALPGIHPRSFEHPLDRAALETLRKTPGLDILFRKLASLHFERIVRMHFTGDSLRLTPRQGKSIYKLLEEACYILDMPEPDLYLMHSPVANAYAIGMERHSIVLTSALVDMLSEDELLCILAHELGHIKSGHMLYRTMAIFLGVAGMIAARNLPFVNILSEMLRYALFDWTRKSELTADRAGLLVVQNLETALNIDLKISGGWVVKSNELSIEEFLKQADDYEDMDSNLLNVYYKFDITRFQTHPFPALRAKELHKWANSPAYERILRGEYDRTTANSAIRTCGRCNLKIENPVFRFCPDCGNPI